MKARAFLLLLPVASVIAWFVPAAQAAVTAGPGALVVPAADADGKYTVKWRASTTAGSAYTVQEAVNSTFTAGLRTIKAGTATSVAITGRVARRTYYYRVRAQRAGWTASSWRVGENGCAVPGVAAAAPPSVVKVPSLDADGSFLVQWGASPTLGATYVLEEAANATFTAGRRVVYTGTLRSRPIAGKAGGSSWYYRVRALKAGLRDSAWRVAGNRCLVTAPLAAPTLTLMAATDADRLEVAWLAGTGGGAPYGQVSYQVHLGTQEGFAPSAATLKKTVTGASQAVVTGLSPDTLYHAVVVAVSPYNRPSAPSNALQARTFKSAAGLDPAAVISDAGALGMGAFTTQDGATFLFPDATGTAPAVGSLLFAKDASGATVLRRVDAVDTPGGVLTVVTSPASLTDAVTRGSVSSSFRLVELPASLAGSGRAGSNVPTGTEPIGNTRRVDWRGGLLSAEQTDFAPPRPGGAGAAGVSPEADGGPFSVTATAQFQPTLVTEAVWGGTTPGTLESARVAARGTLTLNAEAAYNFEASGTAEKNFELFKRRWVSVYVLGATGIPVYQQVELTVSVAASASAEAKVDAVASVTATETVEVGAVYDGTSWSTYVTHAEGHDETASLNIAGKVSGEVRVIPEIKVTFYQAASATLSVEPYTSAAIAVETTTNNLGFLAAHPERLLQVSTFDVKLGVQANAAVNLSVLGVSWDALPKTCVLGPEACTVTLAEMPIFTLPQLEIAETTAPDATEKEYTLKVTDGDANALNQGSVRWEVFPSDATITPGSCAKSGEVTSCTAKLSLGEADKYAVFASGFGVLGEPGRQFKEENFTSCNATVMWQGNEWQRCGSQSAMTRDEAVTYCENLVEGGHDDWRLPTIEELMSLLWCSNGTVPVADCDLGITPYQCGNGFVDPYVQPTIVDQSFTVARCQGCEGWGECYCAYWSSTTCPVSTASFVVYFGWGQIAGMPNDFLWPVARCVRTGP